MRAHTFRKAARNSRIQRIADLMRLGQEQGADFDKIALAYETATIDSRVSGPFVCSDVILPEVACK